MKAAKIKQLDLDLLEKGKIYRFWLSLTSDGFGDPLSIPIFVAQGAKPGPILGLSSAIHGNEINGIPVIQQLFRELDPSQLSGTILAAPVVNIPSFFRKRRRFQDNVDLNHIMPGKARGNVSQAYAYAFFHKFVEQVDYLVDFHTASFGRINSYYIRADMSNQVSAEMARRQNPQIILHNPAVNGTLRGAAEAIGIPAITLELGNPNVFQPAIIAQSLEGVYNVLAMLNMFDHAYESQEGANIPVCQSSKWIYTRKGGLLHVHPKVTDYIEKGQLIAHQENIFGDRIAEYRAPQAGIIIGKSVSPVNSSGGRILHLGILK